MPKILIEKPEGMPERVAKFAAENELNRRMRRIKNIKEATDRLNLKEDDLEKLEEARAEL